MEQHPLGGFGVFDLTGFPKVLEMEQKYLSSEELQRDERSVVVYDPKPAGALPAPIHTLCKFISTWRKPHAPTK